MEYSLTYNHQSQFIEMFGKYPLVSSLGQECQVYTGSTPARNRLEYWNGTFPWVSAQDMSEKYIYDTVEKITEQGKNICRIIPAGSIAFVCRGSIGLQSIINIDCATNQSICTATCGENINNEFLYYFLKIETEKIKKSGLGTSFKSINQKDFSSIRIPVPPLNLQENFATIVRQADKSKYYVQNKLNYICHILTKQIQLKRCS